MELIKNKNKYSIGFDDENLIKEFSKHIIFYSIILYINCSQEIFKLIRKIKKFKSRMFIKYFFFNLKLNKKELKNKLEKNDLKNINIKNYLNYNIFDPNEINNRTENNYFQSEYDLLQKIQFKVYLIVYNYVPLISYILKKEMFKDEDIKKEIIYKIFKPIDNSNFYSGDLPDLTDVFEKMDFLLRKKPLEENYYHFFFSKLSPTICQIRDFENIIKTIYEKSKKIKILLNKAIECSMLGLYEFSNHDVLIKDFGSLINLYYTFYEKNAFLKTSEKREKIFYSFQENKVAIRILSRTLYIFYIENYKILRDNYFKKSWGKKIYKSFCYSNILNNNTLSEFFLYEQRTLKKFKEKIKIQKNSNISEKEKTTLSDLLNNDNKFWEFLKLNKKILDKKKIFSEVEKKKKKLMKVKNLEIFF